MLVKYTLKSQKHHGPGPMMFFLRCQGIFYQNRVYFINLEYILQNLSRLVEKIFWTRSSLRLLSKFDKNCPFFQKFVEILPISPNRLTCSVFILLNFASFCFIIIDRSGNRAPIKPPQTKNPQKSKTVPQTQEFTNRKKGNETTQKI